MLNEQEDDVRLYLVPASPRGDWHGPLPAGDAITVTGSPAANLAERLAGRRKEGGK